MSTPKKPRGVRTLSEDEKSLWSHTAATVEPLRPKQRKLALKAKRASDAPLLHVRPADPGPVAETARRTIASTPKPSPPPLKIRPALPPLTEPTARDTRRLRSGRMEIDARLDLHGMRQHDAHLALVGFLRARQANGAKWVLIITGKGGRGRTPRHDDGYGSDEPGVLRRNVPRWLAEPELRAIVVGFRPASISHGGDGALYVQLRVRRS